MGEEMLKKVIKKQREQLIDQLLKVKTYKSLDGRQLYELTLNELKVEAENHRKSWEIL